MSFNPEMLQMLNQQENQSNSLTQEQILSQKSKIESRPRPSAPSLEKGAKSIGENATKFLGLDNFGSNDTAPTPAQPQKQESGFKLPKLPDFGNMLKNMGNLSVFGHSVLEGTIKSGQKLLAGIKDFPNTIKNWFQKKPPASPTMG
jgi:hypothetical protein